MFNEEDVRRMMSEPIMEIMRKTGIDQIEVSQKDGENEESTGNMAGDVLASQAAVTHHEDPPRRLTMEEIEEKQNEMMKDQG